MSGGSLPSHAGIQGSACKRLSGARWRQSGCQQPETWSVANTKPPLNTSRHEQKTSYTQCGCEIYRSTILPDKRVFEPPYIKGFLSDQGILAIVPGPQKYGAEA